MMRDISWALRFLITAWVVVSTAAKASSLPKNYPLEVHHMVQQRIGNRKVTEAGTWAAWSAWSACTRTCGGGVAMQTRDCDPASDDSRRRRRVRTDSRENSTLGPRDSKSQCVGVYKRFHMCNEQSCPPGAKDYRQLQCESYDGKQVMGKSYMWEAFLDAPNKCELNCRAIGFRFYATLNKTVIDGTPCRGATKGSWVCVSGLCKQVGCDGVVGSTKHVDACGVCGGNNNTCRLVSGLFTRPQLPEGYSLIAQVPRGACNITISEMKPSRNYLALRRNDGTYVINGNWAINWSGDYDAVGTKFSYKRQDANNGESILSPGPLLEPVDLMVIYQQPNPGIKYEYMLPMKVDPGPLIVPTGPGEMTPQLIPGINSLKDDITVKDGPVYDGTTPKRPDNPLYPYGTGVLGTESQSRNGHHSNHQNSAPVGDEAHKPQPRTRVRKRKFTWKHAGFTECTKSCGGGLQSPISICVREHNQMAVADKRCAYQDKPHPQIARCNMKPCPAEWVAGEWSNCPVTCGEGTQTRDVMCKQEITATLTMKVAEGACLNPSTLSRIQKCIQPPCAQHQPHKPQWQTGQWGQCSSKCGQGLRSRSVKCLGAGVEEVEDCPQNDRPAHEETCDMGSCSTHSAWFFTEWTQQCSEECGKGVQTRKVHCGGPEACDSSFKPEQSRACSSDKQCSGKWFAGPWGQCSSGCGQGRQTRDAVCVGFIRGQYRVVLDMNCPAGLRPDTERACEAKSCDPEWFFTDWSQCSRECGTGVQKRDVRCLDEKLDASLICVEDMRPPNRRACNTQECSASQDSGSDNESDRSSRHTPRSKVDDEPLVASRPGDQATIQHDTVHKGSDCIDKFRNCHLVVQARLCRYKYYGNSCCHSCHKKT